MVKAIVLFYQAEDPSMLDDYYYNHYLPLILRVPGVIKVESARIYIDLKKVFMKQKDTTPMYHIASEIYFEDIAAFERGFSTEVGEYIASSTVNVAWDVVTVVMGDVATVTPDEYKQDPTFVRRILKK